MIAFLPVAAGAETLDRQDIPEIAWIKEAFEYSGRLKHMSPGRGPIGARGDFASWVGPDSELRVGDKEVFVARRSPFQIITSGISSGCGDYAAAFYDRLKKKYFVKDDDILFIDSAMISVLGLIGHNAGHTGVAVRSRTTERWILTDPTARRIVLYDWNPDSRVYKSPLFNGIFWIGYKGPLETCPQRNGCTKADRPGDQPLVKFYTATLAKVPPKVLSDNLVRIDFVIDDSLRGRNPNLNRFLNEVRGYYAAIKTNYGAEPRESARVHLAALQPTEGLRKKYGPNSDAVTTFDRDTQGDLIAHVGSKSAMSFSLFADIEMRVLERFRWPSME